MSLTLFDNETLPLPEDTEELLLVAYMDNELGAEERRTFEKRLATEPALRQKLTDFERAWNALDFLDTCNTDREQVGTTLEMIAVRVEEEARTLASQQKRKTGIHTFFFLLGLLLAAFVGYCTFDRLYAVDEEQKIYDLLLIERLDQYRLLDERPSSGIDEIEFLRQLHESKILD